ncbi:MAG: YbaB/EbfC family nucleoid-associated protein [Alkalispirochaetaceae bacterium]
MNPMDLLKNFQGLQDKLKESQAKLKTVTVTGTAGGDMVRITINGEFRVLQVEIADEVVEEGDKEMIQDLVRAAFTDATVRLKEQLQQEMSSITGGLDIPPGLFG